MIKVGVVGLGIMGENHVRLYSKLNCRLAGVSDIDPVKARQTGEKYGVPYFNDYHALIPQVDAVSIAVPTTMHHKVALDFLNQGIHCLVEKPVASSLDEAEDMVEASRKSGANLSIGHIEQYNPAVLKLKQILTDNRLGRILMISTRRVGPYVPRIRDVGIVIDSATHDIGVANFLLNKLPLSVYARCGRLKHSKEDHAIIVLDYGDTTASIEVNWFTPHKVRTLVITGSEGTANLDYIQQTLILHNSHATEDIEIQKAEPLLLELRDFLTSIETKRHPSIDGRQGINILRLALVALEKTVVSI